jgi:tight adherence protein B
MTDLLIVALVFLGTLGIVVGAYTVSNRGALSASDAALERLRDVEEAQVAAKSILRGESVSDLPALDRFLAERALTGVIARRLQQAGVEITPGLFLLVIAMSALTGLVLSRLFSPTMIAAIIGTILGAGAPLLWLSRKEQARLNLFQEQLPEAMDMLVSAMKAGYSFQAAMKFIGDEIPEPLGPEFARFYEEQRLGLEVRTALLAMQERVSSLDLKMFVTALLIQRETGGNLGEVLGKIGSLMRERAAIKGEIATLTAESKLSARILGALPFVVFGLVSLLNPGFMTPMLETSWGPWVFLGAATSVFIGYRIMMSIASIEV